MDEKPKSSELRIALERDITLEDDIYYPSTREECSENDYIINMNGEICNLDGTKCFEDDNGIFFTSKDLEDTKTKNYADAKLECFQKNLSFQFYRYNPFDLDTIPRDGNGCLVDINQRALFILQITDFKRLNKAMLNFRDAQIVTGTFIDYENDGDGYGAWLVSSDVTTLVSQYMNSRSFPFDSIFDTEYTLTEARPLIYALLSLYLIGTIANSNLDKNKYHSDMKIAVDAMEAICEAERLKNSFSARATKEELRAEFRKEQASNAGRASVSTYESAGTFKAVFEYYKKAKPDFCKRGARARFISDMIEKSIDGTLPMPSKVDSLNERTISNWIKKFDTKI